MISVLKFGGTSLRNSAAVNRAAEIVKSKSEKSNPVVVVSAIAGVTDQLILMADRYADNTDEIETRIDTLMEMHHHILDELLTNTHGEKRKAIDNYIDELVDELRENLKELSSSNGSAKAMRDRILSIGERLSSFIFSKVLADRGLTSDAHVASKFVRTNARHGEADVDTEVTRSMIRDHLLPLNGNVPVVTGFIGSTPDNVITTLGRSGSDYSASLLGEALDADEIEIWTDVNGILTADPHIVPNAQPIRELNYDDIAELSQHGAKVIHPKTITPLYGSNIPLWVKNSYHPEQEGTLITSRPTRNGAFRSVTVAGPYLYVNLHSKSYHPITQHTHSLLELLKEHNFLVEQVNSQKSDEQIRLLINTDDEEGVLKLLNNWEGCEECSVDYKPEVYQIKYFNNQLKTNTRLSRAVAAMLSKKGVNPISFHKAAGARFLNLLVAREEAYLTARLINDHICNGHHTVHVFLAGLGTIGGTVHQQLMELKELPFDVHVIGACNSRNMIWNEIDLNLENLHDELEKGEDTHWPTIIERLSEPQRYRTIFVDATGNPKVAGYYADLMETGIHITTPSKMANAMDQSYFDKLMKLRKEMNVEYEYETTVGAALPLLNTLVEMQRNGDRITELAGVVSGTLTYVFTKLEEGEPFAETISNALEMGYTEPDPRDDLSGEDVVRKFMILSRTLDDPISREEIEVTSLVPDELQDCDVDTFLKELQKYDKEWSARIKQALEHGKTLRYVGRYTDAGIKVGVEEVPKGSPLGQLKGTDNILQIYSERYSHSPIVIQGPGAGKEVTAAGLINDIIKIGTKIVD